MSFQNDSAQQQSFATDSEQQFLDAQERSYEASHQQRCANVLSSRKFHHLVLSLVILDSCIVLVHLGYAFLHLQPRGEVEEEPLWLEILAYISIVIGGLFILELPFSIWGFGFDYYNPFGEVTHASFHLADAFIIITSFAFDVALRGPAREFASLIIILRLWRLVKLVGGVASGFGDINEDLIKKLRKTEAELLNVRSELVDCKAQLRQAQEHVAELQRKPDVNPDDQ